MEHYMVRTISFSGIVMLFDFESDDAFLDAADFVSLAVQTLNIRVAYLLTDNERVMKAFYNKRAPGPQPIHENNGQP